MSYKLFLDDLRNASADDFITIRTYAAFIEYIKENGLPDFISFDNDLGENEEGNLLPDGYECAKWLVYKSGLDLRNLKFRVHSANPVAKVQIESLLGNYIRFLKENPDC